MTIPAEFRAFRIHSGLGHIAQRSKGCVDQLGEAKSSSKPRSHSINYKDALAGSGGKILRHSPLVGVSAWQATLLPPVAPAFREGDPVLCTGCGCPKPAMAAIRSTFGCPPNGPFRCRLGWICAKP